MSRDEGNVPMTHQDVQAVMDYIEWAGPRHDDDCPQDDTCNCQQWAGNDAFNLAIIRMHNQLGMAAELTRLRAERDKLREMLVARDNANIHLNKKYWDAVDELTESRRRCGVAGEAGEAIREFVGSYDADFRGDSTGMVTGAEIDALRAALAELDRP